MRTPIIICTFALLSFFSITSSTAQNISGTWVGDIEMPNAKLKMVFHIHVDDNNTPSATLDVPQQGASGIHVSKINKTTDSLTLKVPTIMGTFKGRYENKDSLAGQWTQMGRSFPLNLKRSGEITKAVRPQTPQEPFHYSSTDVEYTNPQSGYKIAGTLTLPRHAEKSAAVILITGSGAQDRDETLFEHKPFWVIADYLSNRGIAVLRVDDRGVGGSEGNVTDATSADFASDVLSGIEFLRSREDIDHSRIGLIGHSEGGIIAPMVATQSKHVAFIVLLAGVGIPGDSLLIEQVQLIAKTAGANEQRVNAQLFVTKGIINVLKKEQTPQERSLNLCNAATNGMYAQMDKERQEMVQNQLKAYDNNWYSFMVSYDPRPTLAKVKCPVLALNGSKDLQVPAQMNLTAIKNALTDGGNHKVTTHELPNLNHLFQECETGLPLEYAQIEQTISPTVLELMNEWIHEITK